MEKIRIWIKRPVNANFAIFMGIALFLAVFALYSYKARSGTTDLLNKLGGWLDNARGEVADDVEGYGIIIGSIAHGIGTAGNAIIIFLLTYVPLFMSVITVIQTVFTRLLYHPKSPSRILCYRISMAFCSATLVFHIIIFSVLLFKFYSGVLMFLIDAVIIAGIVVCLRNTYSKRIKIYSCS